MSGGTPDRRPYPIGRRAVLAGLAAGVTGLAGCSVDDLQVPHQGRDRSDERGTLAPPQTSGFDDQTRDRARRVGVNVRSAVVVVGGGRPGPGSRSLGTGWLYDNRIVVTNSHVVARMESPSIETLAGESYEATVMGRVQDMLPDVAALELESALDVDPLPKGSSDQLSEGQPLVQVGHPGTVGKWAIGLGRFRGQDQRLNWLLSSVPTVQGNSGSPLITLDGDVVGLTSGTRPKPGHGPDRVFDGDEPPVFAENYPDTDLSAHVAIGTVEERVEQWRQG